MTYFRNLLIYFIILILLSRFYRVNIIQIVIAELFMIIIIQVTTLPSKLRDTFNVFVIFIIIHFISGWLMLFLVCLVGNQRFVDNRYSGPSVHQDSGWLVLVLAPYDSFRYGFIRQVNQIHRLLLDLFVFVWALPDCMSRVTVKTTELSFLPGPVVGWRRTRLLAV